MLAAVVMLAGALPAGAKEHYLAAGAIDVAQLLAAPAVPRPPAACTADERAELAVVLERQAARTEADVAFARFMEEDDLFKDAAALGDWFTERNLPRTGKFFARVDRDVKALHVKGFLTRKRPPFVDARVQPCVRVADTSSYPSGHALRAWLRARLLGEIFPGRREALRAFAEKVAQSRVTGGAHFPSDIAAGRALGEAIADALLKNPAVRAELARCRAEAEPFLLKRAA